MKYVLVTGGVASGSAKGVTALTVDLLRKAFTPIKIDPYLNTEEGPANVCVIQLGGTIGDDIESDPFIKALGQFSYRVGRWNFCCVFFSVVPVLNVVGEQKLWGLRLRGLGSTPDILVCCLGDEAPEENVKEKIAQSCHVPLEYIFALSDVSNIRHILLLLEAHLAISKVLNLASRAGPEGKRPKRWLRASTYKGLYIQGSLKLLDRPCLLETMTNTLSMRGILI